MYLLFAITIVFSQYDSFDYDFLKKKKESNQQKVISKKESKNSFEALIKGSEKKEGLFNYYWNSISYYLF